MKEKRNCGTPYPVYPQPVPIMEMPLATPYMAGYNQGYTQNSISSNTIEQQMTNLETRVSRLENMLNTNNSNSNSQYNGSNYYMV